MRRGVLCCAPLMPSRHSRATALIVAGFYRGLSSFRESRSTPTFSEAPTLAMNAGGFVGTSVSIIVAGRIEPWPMNTALDTRL